MGQKFEQGLAGTEYFCCIVLGLWLHKNPERLERPKRSSEPGHLVLLLRHLLGHLIHEGVVSAGVAVMP